MCFSVMFIEKVIELNFNIIPIFEKNESFHNRDINSSFFSFSIQKYYCWQLEVKNRGPYCFSNCLIFHALMKSVSYELNFSVASLVVFCELDQKLLHFFFALLQSLAPIMIGDFCDLFPFIKNCYHSLLLIAIISNIQSYH